MPAHRLSPMRSTLHFSLHNIYAEHCIRIVIARLYASCPRRNARDPRRQPIASRSGRIATFTTESLQSRHHHRHFPVPFLVEARQLRPDGPRAVPKAEEEA